MNPWISSNLPAGVERKEKHGLSTPAPGIGSNELTFSN